MDMKPGYLLKITTWENDADNYNTVDFDGLDVNQTNMLIDIAELFESRHSQQGFGNSDCSGANRDLLFSKIDAIIEEYRSKGTVIPEQWDKQNPDFADYMAGPYADDFYSDPIYDMIGIWREGELYRVFDDYQVFLVPDQAPQDVTDSFR